MTLSFSTLAKTDFSLPHRYEQLVSGVKKFDSDGINSVKYEVRALERKVLYTWILVDVKHESVSKQMMKNVAC